MRSESGPVRCSCPTNSDTSFGRRRSARGIVAAVALLSFCRLAGREVRVSVPSGSYAWDEDDSETRLDWVNTGAADLFLSFFVEEDARDVEGDLFREPVIPLRQLESKCWFISASITVALQTGHSTNKNACIRDNKRRTCYGQTCLGLRRHFRK